VFPAVLTHICCADNSFTQLLDTMAAMSASSVTFKTAVAPRVVRSRATKLTRATRGSVATQAAVTKIPVSEVKDHLDRGFVLVDIRDPDEAKETGYKSSWKNVVVRPFTRPRLPVTRPIPTDDASLRPRIPTPPPSQQLAAMDEEGNIHMNPNFLAQIRQEFPNTMSRILIACDDGTTRSEKACTAIVEKCGYTQCKVIEGGIDAYLAAYPLTQADKVKWRTRPEIGQDLSVLVSGVDTRQAGEIYY
jgi:rhodanese-related sulfurtransferase